MPNDALEILQHFVETYVPALIKIYFVFDATHRALISHTAGITAVVLTYNK
jgi:hypothetical protein